MNYSEFQGLLPDLVKGYPISSRLQQRLGEVTLLMIIGPSGAGKTTIMKELGYPYVASDTTRSKRIEETDGLDYTFRTDYYKLASEVQHNEFVQVAAVHDHFYGTRTAVYPESGIATMAVATKAVNTFRALPFAKTISAFLMPKTYETLLDRMGSHGLSDTDRTTRLAEARGSIETSLKDFKETKLTHFILNDSLELALQQIRALTTEDFTDTNRESEARSES